MSAGHARTRTAGLARQAAVVVLLGCTVLAGCAGGGSTTATPAPATTAAPATTTTTASAELCSAAAEFQTAVNGVVTLDAAQVGVEGVKAALGTLRTAGQNLVAAAQAQFGPQVDELQSALDGLGTTVSTLSDQASLSSKFGALAASFSAVEQAAQPIMDGARASCSDIPAPQTPAGS